MKELLITLGALVLLTLLSVLFDVFVREELFNYSLEAIEKFQSNKDNLVPFFKFLSFLCTENVLVPCSIIIYVLFPMNKSFAFITALVLANYFDNIMKIMYGNPRPYWVKESLFRACDGGFGNPSGHSFVSTTAYLSIAHLLIGINSIKRKALKILVNVFIWSFFLLVIAGIIISRVFLGVHSINQVLYGSFLGAITYFFCFFALSTHTQTSKTFFNSFNSNKSIIIYLTLYSIGIVIALLLYFLIENKPDSIWIASMAKHCSGVHEYRRYNNDALFASFLLFFLFGSHSGMILSFRLLNKNKDKGDELITRIIHWNNGSFIQLIYKILLLIPFMLILLMFVIVPSDISLPVIFIFKITIPFYLIGFFVFGPYLIACSALQLLPEKEMQEETNELKGIRQESLDEIIHSNEIDGKVSNKQNSYLKKKDEEGDLIHKNNSINIE